MKSLQGPENIFNQIIEENFYNMKKEMPINIQEVYKAPITLVQKRKSSHHIIIYKIYRPKKERGKGQVTYKGRPIRTKPDFSSKTLKVNLDRYLATSKRTHRFQLHHWTQENS